MYEQKFCNSFSQHMQKLLIISLVFAVASYLLVVTVPFFNLKYTKKVQLLQGYNSADNVTSVNASVYPGYNPLLGTNSGLDICGDNLQQTCSATSSFDIPLRVVQAGNSVSTQFGKSSSDYVLLTEDSDDNITVPLASTPTGDLCSLLRDSVVAEWRAVNASIVSERALKILLCTSSRLSVDSLRSMTRDQTDAYVDDLVTLGFCQLVDDCLAADSACVLDTYLDDTDATLVEPARSGEGTLLHSNIHAENVPRKVTYGNDASPVRICGPTPTRQIGTADQWRVNVDGIVLLDSDSSTYLISQLE
jgi:hypothetical protein